MRKIVLVLFATILLFSLTSGALAEPKPTNVPHQVLPGEAGFAAAFGANTFDSLWMDMSGANELPVGWSSTSDAGDDYIRGPVDIGFTFHFMEGPVEPAPGWPPGDWDPEKEPMPPYPDDWPSYLSDAGYDGCWVADNGYLVFGDIDLWWEGWQDPNIGRGVNGCGQTAHYCDMALGPQRPNNFIAPFWADWVLGDNNHWVVNKVCKIQVGTVWDEEQQMDVPVYEYLPCEKDGWRMEERPRGKLLYQTFGTAPNRVFVVEWHNARNSLSGNLVSFQCQLFEGSNAILFLYAHPWPAEDGRPFFQEYGAVIGMEDAFGKTFVGEFFTSGVETLPMFKWVNAPAPVANEDMRGFVY